ncbi:major facilitator superfamily domain-containing protein [Melampsora americana]|nr:major facilitator superfamily domain-containing protein [Melampsora americana]
MMEQIPTKHELDNPSIEKITCESYESGEEIILPPYDKGFRAWRFLFIAFMIDGIVFGPPMAFGVFLDYSPYSEMHKALSALIATLCSGILYCLGAVISPLMEKYPWITKWGPALGTLICSASCLASGYSSKPWHLIISQGLCYGIGGSLIYYPGFIFLGEWWVERRGFGGSVMFSGASVCGIVYPLVLEWSLKKFGTAITHRAFAVFWLVAVLPMLPFYHGRLPISYRKNSQNSSMSSYLKTPIFWTFMFINLIQSMAFFVPSLYMPTYATLKGYSGGMILAIFSGACILGQLLVGTLSDYFDCSWLIAITSVFSGISIFGLWGHSNGLAMLVSFAVIYGLSAGGFSCLWQRFAMRIAPNESKSGNLCSFFATSRGIANMVTGPIAGAFLHHSSTDLNGYQNLAYYSGSLMIFSSLGVAVRLLYTHKQTF